MSKVGEGSGSAIYGLGFIGAIVYFMQAATSFAEVILGFLKALVWPAIVVYEALEGFFGIVS